MQNEEMVGRSGAPNSGPWRMSHHRNHLIATSWEPMGATWRISKHKNGYIDIIDQM